MPIDSPVPQSVLEAAENATDPSTRMTEDGRQEETWGKPAGLWEACVGPSTLDVGANADQPVAHHSKSYKRHGALFWPDYVRSSLHPSFLRPQR